MACWVWITTNPQVKDEGQKPDKSRPTARTYSPRSAAGVLGVTPAAGGTSSAGLQRMEGKTELGPRDHGYSLGATPD